MWLRATLSSACGDDGELSVQACSEKNRGRMWLRRKPYTRSPSHASIGKAGNCSQVNRGHENADIYVDGAHRCASHHEELHRWFQTCIGLRVWRMLNSTNAWEWSFLYGERRCLRGWRRAISKSMGNDMSANANGDALGSDACLWTRLVTSTGLESTRRRQRGRRMHMGSTVCDLPENRKADVNEDGACQRQHLWMTST